MAKQLYDSNGRPIALPENKEDAKRFRYSHYDCKEECLKCVRSGYSGIITRKRYTANDDCVHCAMLKSLEFQSIATYRTALDRDGDRFLCVVLDTNVETEVEEGYFNELSDAVDFFGDMAIPTTRDGAAKIGVGYYVRDVPCRTHGHIGVVDIKGDCYYCSVQKTQLTPRQEAIKAGKYWYTPETPCPRCDALAERRVDNGQCRGCKPPEKAANATKELMKNNPTMVISRDDAKVYGFTVYRTGEECRKGHKGYRYVSTGNCLDCLLE